MVVDPWRLLDLANKIWSAAEAKHGKYSKKLIESVQQVTSFLYFAMPPDWRAELQVKFKGDGVTFFAHLLSFFGGKHRNQIGTHREAMFLPVVEPHAAPSSAWLRHALNHMTHYRGLILENGGVPPDEAQCITHFLGENTGTRRSLLLEEEGSPAASHKTTWL